MTRCVTLSMLMEFGAMIVFCSIWCVFFGDGAYLQFAIPGKKTTRVKLFQAKPLK